MSVPVETSSRRFRSMISPKTSWAFGLAPVFGLIRAPLAAFWRAWEALSLSTQFLLAASIVLVSTMAILGAWISAQIEERVVQNTAVSTAFYMDSLIEPALQSLVTGDEIDATTAHEIDRILTQTQLGKTIATIKIWGTRGKIIYSTTKEQIGKSFPETAGFKTAMTNQIVAEFDDLNDAENEAEKLIGRALLEVYSPIHQHGTNRVIAVAELYQFGDTLREDIAKTRWNTFLVVGASTVGMLAMLFSIVRRGNATILAQRSALESQISKLAGLLKQNDDLNQRIVTARKLALATNERLLRRVGADLHDGPAQLLGLALLYYDSLTSLDGTAGKAAPSQRFETVRGLLQDALGELRNISAGIAPPELDNLTPKQTVNLAILNHERRTSAVVKANIGELPAKLPISLKICFYRFVQEGLNNTFHHAKGAEAQVVATVDGSILNVEVSDSGPGMDLNSKHATCGLGLAGMTDRIEASDGTLKIISSAGNGTRLIAQFNLRNDRGRPL